MEAQKVEDVFDGILAYIKGHGREYSDWYVGIASDWKERLVVDHNVAKEHHWWIVRQCYTNREARKIETALLRFGCDGGPRSDTEDTVYAYAYLKSNVTKP